jgi:hypothetical protein
MGAGTFLSIGGYLFVAAAIHYTRGEPIIDSRSRSHYRLEWIPDVAPTRPQVVGARQEFQGAAISLLQRRT